MLLIYFFTGKNPSSLQHFSSSNGIVCSPPKPLHPAGMKPPLLSSDLFIDASCINIKSLVGMWPRSIAGTIIPIGASAFGDLFFQRPEGNVEKLDVLEGGVHHAACHLEEFKLLMGSRYWRDTHLMSHCIASQRSKGLPEAKDSSSGSPSIRHTSVGSIGTPSHASRRWNGTPSVPERWTGRMENPAPTSAQPAIRACPKLRIAEHHWPRTSVNQPR